ncbi:aspartate--tRNA ligase [Marispirochaeta aestuarii]|uniref:aspartate--tRNA ligase n=1 Tax=Marispirochaeta aestuarii TaxID=1963862 RepID=UPI002ABD58DF|nr:aspartate--tRNA ligase [Marispirochaeta aestuarii]
MSMYRTHRLNELRESHVGQEVTLSGWINNHRDHGGVLFIDLRDNYGITQLVSYPESGFKYEVAHLQKENCIRVTGTVKRRDPETVNPKIETGEIEVEIKNYEILGKCNPLPFQIFPEDREPEELRLTYRYLDLRRETIHRNILMRSKVISSVRRRMEALGFTEFQTPILTASSPEGARDFLVPSRLHPGQFYALPQAPQQYKQLLMVAGFDRYFQIAPCFRDEDARANRSPGEFYQIDMEMSFVEQDEVFAVIEELMTGLFSEFSDWKISSPPFERIPYAEAMLKYGSDKPDLRNPIVIRDVTEAFKGSDFKAFAGAIASGAVVRALPVKGISGQPRSFFDKLIEYAQSVGSKGLAYITWTGGEVKSPIAKFLSEESIRAIADACDVNDGDVVFFVCDQSGSAAAIAGQVRNKLGRDLDLLEKNSFRFCWIVDYPMYERDEHTGKIEFSHNPFSMPQGGLEALNEKDPLEILAFQYDLVCNGEELSSGAIRNHQPEVMYRAFEIGGYTREEVDSQFAGMINAFRYGAPPHGGIAPGLDRIIMLLANVENLREIVAFPMNQKAQEPMMGSPREVSEKQLEELHIRVELPDEEL